MEDSNKLSGCCSLLQPWREWWLDRGASAEYCCPAFADLVETTKPPSHMTSHVRAQRNASAESPKGL